MDTAPRHATRLRVAPRVEGDRAMDAPAARSPMERPQGREDSPGPGRTLGTAYFE